MSSPVERSPIEASSMDSDRKAPSITSAVVDVPELASSRVHSRTGGAEPPKSPLPMASEDQASTSPAFRLYKRRFLGVAGLVRFVASCYLMARKRNVVH